MAPPRKNLLLVSNGLMAKAGHRQGRRSGAADHLRALAEERHAPAWVMGFSELS